MIYQCDACGALFTEPQTFVEYENLDGENGWEVRHINVCPFCGCDEIERRSKDELV